MDVSGESSLGVELDETRLTAIGGAEVSRALAHLADRDRDGCKGVLSWCSGTTCDDTAVGEDNTVIWNCKRHSL